MTRAPDRLGEAKIGPENPFFEIIEEAYRVFDCPKPLRIEVCEGCCMDPAIEADFFKPPIAELPLSYVQDWFFAAYDPETGVAKPTWAYLLPRILEILATGEDVDNCGLEVSLQRFPSGNSDHWSHDQWQVLDQFQRLYLKLQLERAGPFENSSDPIDDVLCMFAKGGWQVEGLLDQLLGASDTVLAERFFLDWSLEHVREYGSIWITAFWDAEGRDKVWAFYTSQAIHDRMARLALDDDVNPKLAEKAYCVANVLSANQDSPD